MKKFVQHRFFFPVCSFGLAFVCLLISCILFGFYPFGDKTVFTVDLYFQYAPMLAHLRRSILDGNISLYSFTIGSGTSVLPLAAYYLFSPFNVILLFFSERLLSEAVLLIIILKLAFSAGTCAFSLESIVKKRSPFVLIFSLGYALSAYSMAYLWNVMWLDIVIALPLVVAAFERMMRTEKITWYVVFLSFCMCVNYYISFMVCLFLVIYFLYYLLRENGNMRNNIEKFIRFILASLICAGCSMVVLLPVIISNMQVSAANVSPFKMESMSSIINLFGRSLFCSHPTIRSGDLPNIYVGVLVLIVCGIFFVLSKISIREKIASAVLLFGIFISMLLQPIDLVWHGLHTPNDLPCRYSFIFCFVMVLLGFNVVARLDQIKSKNIKKIFFILIGALIIFDAVSTLENGTDVAIVYGSLFLMIVYFLWLWYYSKRKVSYKLIVPCLTIFFTVEMVYNSVNSFYLLDQNECFCKHINYVDNDKTEHLRSALSQVHASDKSLYREECLPRFTCVDTALFGYRGLSTFASSNPVNFIRFMKNMGYSTNSINSCMYRDFSKFTDSIFGIKYLTVKNDYDNLDRNSLEKSIMRDSMWDIYQNVSAMPIAFAANQNVKKFNALTENPFESQSMLFKAMFRKNVDLYKRYLISNDPDIFENSFSISKERKFTFDVDESATQPIYVYVDAKDAFKIRINNGDKNIDIDNPNESFVVNVGKVNVTHKVSVNIIPKDNLKSMSGHMYVAQFLKNNFDNFVEQSRDGYLRVTDFSDTKIKGMVKISDDQVLFTSIPYSKGWQVKVDGNLVDTFAIDHALLGADVPYGEHLVEIYFVTPGFWWGVLISFVSVVLFILYCMFLHRIRYFALKSKENISVKLEQGTVGDVDSRSCSKE